MPIGDIAGEALGGIGRIIVWIFVEVVFEILIRGAGHVVLRTLRPKSDPGDIACVFVGLLVWMCLLGGAFLLYGAANGA